MKTEANRETAGYRKPYSAYRDLLKKEELLVSADSGEGVFVDYLSYDTRDLKENTLFFCKGVHFRTEYLTEAAKGGAVCYVSEVRCDSPLPCLLVRDVRRAMSLLAVFHYDDPSSRLQVIGLTGTKGKSTTAYYIKSVLDRALPRECGILSSIDNYDGAIREESHLTTPEAVELHHHFVHALDHGLSHLVMEVSSQGLKYGRVEGVTFSVACFTNIGSDHISPIEHPDFEDYFASKLKIFDNCRVGCVNMDAEFAPRVLAVCREKAERTLTYGSDPSCDIYCMAWEKREDGIWFRVRTPVDTDWYSITMPGIFNIENALAAITVCYALGIPGEYVKAGLRTARAKGRMEVFPSEDGRMIAIVDYAHNKMSFRALYESVKQEYPGKRIFFIFGSAGGKAYSRRRDLGDSAGLYADYSILTEEDSGEEPFMRIAADLAERIELQGGKGKYAIIEDREAAIADALLHHGTDIVALILGKGRETRQKRGTQYIETPSDVDYTEKYLAEYNRRNARASG